MSSGAASVDGVLNIYNAAKATSIDAPFARNHRAWLQSRVARGRRVERVRVGSRSQLAPRGHGAFELRFVAGDGAVWTGEGEGGSEGESEGSRPMLADRTLPFRTAEHRRACRRARHPGRCLPDLRYGQSD